MDSSFRDVLLSPENPVMNVVFSVTLKRFPLFLNFHSSDSWHDPGLG